MKLIIKQYLSSLKERSELDALLPDLLSQMGLNVISRPGRGTSQEGVDVAAVGSVDGGPDQVYLFSIKAGNITRKSWDGEGLQSLRSSLNQIRDSYIKNRLSPEHQEKKIIICICFGGNVQEQVRADLTGFIQENTRTSEISYEEWNGDKLAELIEKNFLREDLLPIECRSLLRKSLALLDEPEASFSYFSSMISSLFSEASKNDVKRLVTIRQLAICLWIMFAWARDDGNLESAYLAAERVVLCAWALSKSYWWEKSKLAKEIKSSFQSILSVYHNITSEYINTKILPHVDKLDGLSTAVRPTSSIDVNLRLFDVLGRLSVFGLWQICQAEQSDEGEQKEDFARSSQAVSEGIQSLISSNSVLLLPIKDDQAIDIFLALFQMSFFCDNKKDIVFWLSEMLERAKFAYKSHSNYPCIIREYGKLLYHPQQEDEDYRKEFTGGSILYPTIALWAALIGDVELYEQVGKFKEECLQHCNFQLWYPDDISEDNFYSNKEVHGAVLSGVPVNRKPEEFLSLLWEECDRENYFEQLSAIKAGLWPLILVACRHYRVPIPVHFTLKYRSKLLPASI